MVSVFEGTRPTRQGDPATETQGIAPIPEDARYGSSWRNFTVWFAPNMELSGVFTGTLAFTLGLGFWSGFAAIVIGVVLGAVPVAYLATWGPKREWDSFRWLGCHSARPSAFPPPSNG